MVVAVALVRVVEPPVDQIVDMVAVRYRRMAAVGPVHVAGWVAAGLRHRSAAVGMVGIDGDHMLVDVPAVRVVEMAVVEVVDVALVPHLRVSTVGPMLMIVVVVPLAVASAHRARSLFRGAAAAGAPAIPAPSFTSF
jgi:hypothetical protein